MSDKVQHDSVSKSDRLLYKIADWIAKRFNAIKVGLNTPLIYPDREERIAKLNPPPPVQKTYPQVVRQKNSNGVNMTVVEGTDMATGVILTSSESSDSFSFNSDDDDGFSFFD